jgi:hypothetical protein
MNYFTQKIKKTFDEFISLKDFNTNQLFNALISPDKYAIGS